MKKAIVALFLIIGCFTFSKAQTNLSDYKYVIVEKQFHFQNEPNEYNLNNLTRFLFTKHGFRTILSNEVYPDDLKSDLCLALNSEITSKGTLRTKITIALRDCNNNIVFQVEGITKEKYFDKVYNIGIRKAMEGFKDVNYNYVEKQKTVIQEKFPNTKTKAKDSNLKIKELNTEIKEIKEKEGNIVVKEKAKEAETPIVNEHRKKETTVIVKEESLNILYAQKIDKGFQIVDSTPKVIMILHRTALENVFVVKDKNAIVFIQDGFWYYSNNGTATELLNIKL
jgi:hypothetical protein